MKRIVLYSLVCILAFGAYANAADVRVRKNIDDLTTEELGNYIHAMDILKKQPSGKNYNYFAELHNSASVGPCEHARDSFLPWHRAHLLAFENALRASDPPRTAKVTVPYWNWSELPSGSRYAKAFETEEILKDRRRYTTPICKTAGQGQCDPLSYPWEYLNTQVLNVKAWSSTGSDNFGGISNEEIFCDDRLDGAYGSLEAPAHNGMHSRYIGGFMSSPSTAARDPIFWSFHAFIDVLWYNWQTREGHKVDTCLECQLCFKAWANDGIYVKVSEYVDSHAQSTDGVNVSYDFTPPSILVASQKEPFILAHNAWNGSTDLVDEKTVSVTIPANPVENAVVEIEDMVNASPISYQINAYLYPADGVEWNPASLEFRSNYMVYLNSIWRAHEGHQHKGKSTQTFRIDLAEELNHLQEQHAGENWVLRILTAKEPELPPETVEALDTIMLGAPPSNVNVDEALKIGEIKLSIN
jgi:hypothetical protein